MANQHALSCPLVALLGLAGACNIPNPAFDEVLADEGVEASDGHDPTGTDGSESQQSESSADDADNSGDSSGDGDGETNGDGDGDGDGETSGDGDSDSGESVSDVCPADPSLVACYRFEAADQVVDGSTHANHGTAAALGLTPGIAGMAMDCATSEAVQIPDSPSLDVLNVVTMAMWVRPEVFPQVGRAVWLDNSGQYGTMFDANFGYVCRILTNQGTSQISVPAELVPLGVWTHIACSYDGSTTRLYANGVAQGSLSAAGWVLSSSTDPVAIGSNSPLFDERCSGQLDAVQIYKRALTGDEIAALAGL